VGCRHRADPIETAAAVGSPSTCTHPSRRGKRCDAANALVCPLVGLLTRRATSRVTTKLTGEGSLIDRFAGWVRGKVTRAPNPADETPNPYAVLGLPRDATPEQVKARFRDLSRKYHPDRSTDPNAGAHFSAITAAYAALTGGQEGAA
jgi:hypothetical protein